MAVNIGPRIGIEGEAEYRKQINSIIQQSKTLASEMKALTTSFDKNNKSLSDNAKQHQLLQEQIKNQEKKVSELNSMLAESTRKYGESADKTLKWKQAVNDAQAELNRLKGELDSLPSSLDIVSAKMAEMGSKLENVGNKIAGIGSKLTSTVTAGVGAAFGASVKSAIDWESAFTGVMKTVDETATTTYADLEKAIMQMATETASSKEEIAGVAEVAGQLGVSADDIVEFTKTMVMLGDTTNLSAEDAATALARFMNITGESQENVAKIGSAIVDLGNNFATTESEIVEMSTRLASAGTIAGLSSTDILALSTAMSSVGIQAEAGGTAMSQTLKTIANAVADFRSGEVEDLQVIADVAEMRAEEFADAWKKDPIKAIQAFVGGLSTMKDAEENVFAILSDMGMEGIRQTNMLQSLALASDMLGDAVTTSTQAYKDNTALAAEAEKRYGTFAAKISQLKQSITNLAVVFGNDLLPYVQKGIDYISNLVKKFSELDQSQRDQIIKVAAIAAAIGPVLMVVGKLIAAFGHIMTFAPQIATAFQAISGGAGAVGASIGACLGPIAAVIAAIGVLVAAFTHLWNTNEQFRTSMTGIWDHIKESFSGFVAQIEARMPQIEAAFTKVVETVKPIWEGFCNLLAPWFQAAFQLISVTLDALFNAIISVIDMITAVLTADKELFMVGLQNFLLTIWTLIQETWATWWGWITSTIDTLLSFFGTSLEEVGTILEAMFTYLWDLVTEKVTELVDFVIEKINEAVDFVAGLPGQFYQWGVEMIQGLIDGVESMIGAVGAAFSNVAQTIASFIHFSEPDVGPLSHFNSWMPDMMKQMAEQIEAGRFQVKVAAANVAADIAAPIAGATNVTLNNNFSFAGGYSEAEGRNIVRQINRQLGALYI